MYEKSFPYQTPEVYLADVFYKGNKFSEIDITKVYKVVITSLTGKGKYINFVICVQPDYNASLVWVTI